MGRLGTAAVDQEHGLGGGRNPTLMVLRRLVRHRGAMLGLVMLLLLVTGAVFAPSIVPHDPYLVDPTRAMQPPSAEQWFGTDRLGRDIFSRVVLGSRISLLLGLVATGIAASVGIATGLVAGYVGGRVDNVIMRVVDILMAFPSLLLAMIAVFALGPNLTNAMIAVGISRVPSFARVTRAEVMAAKENLYVEAARASGAVDGMIMMRHILPNVVAPNLVLATLEIGTAILAGTSLSFLGLGAQAPTPEWGLMLSQGRGFIHLAWWLTFFPGLAIMVTVMAINLLGDGLRDVLDPRLRQ